MTVEPMTAFFSYLMTPSPKSQENPKITIEPEEESSNAGDDTLPDKRVASMDGENKGGVGVKEEVKGDSKEAAKEVMKTDDVKKDANGKDELGELMKQVFILSRDLKKQMNGMRQEEVQRERRMKAIEGKMRMDFRTQVIEMRSRAEKRESQMKEDHQERMKGLEDKMDQMREISLTIVDKSKALEATVKRQEKQIQLLEAALVSEEPRHEFCPSVIPNGVVAPDVTSSYTEASEENLVQPLAPNGLQKGPLGRGRGQTISRSK